MIDQVRQGKCWECRAPGVENDRHARNAGRLQLPPSPPPWPPLTGGPTLAKIYPYPNSCMPPKESCAMLAPRFAGEGTLDLIMHTVQLLKLT